MTGTKLKLYYAEALAIFLAPLQGFRDTIVRTLPNTVCEFLTDDGKLRTLHARYYAMTGKTHNFEERRSMVSKRHKLMILNRMLRGFL